MSRRKSAGIALAVLMHTVESAQAQRIYWYDFTADKIKRAELDGGNVEDIVDLGAVGVSEIAIDQSGGKVYWTEYNESLIRRANLDGSSIEQVLVTDFPWALAIDEVDRRIYWSRGTDFGLSINRADLDGQNEEAIIPTGNSDIEDIAIDTVGRKIYFTAGHGSIGRANLDGSQVESVIQGTGIETTLGLALDLKADKIYWSVFSGNALRRANFDGSNVETLPISVVQPYEVAVDSCTKTIFWNEQSGAIRRSRFDGTHTELIMASGGDFLALQNPFDESTGKSKCIPAASQFGILILGVGCTICAILILGRGSGH